MHDAARVREVDRRGRPRRTRAAGAARGARRVREQLGERHAGEPLHREVRAAVAVAAELVDRRRSPGCSRRAWMRASRRKRLTSASVGARARSRLIATSRPMPAVVRGDDLAHAALADHLAERVAVERLGRLDEVGRPRSHVVVRGAAAASADRSRRPASRHRKGYSAGGCISESSRARSSPSARRQGLEGTKMLLVQPVDEHAQAGRRHPGRDRPRAGRRRRPRVPRRLARGGAGVRSVVRAGRCGDRRDRRRRRRRPS